jgi:hypothetical protein
MRLLPTKIMSVIIVTNIEIPQNWELEFGNKNGELQFEMQNIN